MKLGQISSLGSLFSSDGQCFAELFKHACCLLLFVRYSGQSGGGMSNFDPTRSQQW